MLTIGITGPSGSGKTTALRALADLGGAVIDCDAVYHEYLDACEPMLRSLRRRFGGGVFRPDGTLDRKALGAVVFADEGALSDLNAITHKYVVAEVDAFLRRERRRGAPCAAIDAIALIESGLADRCDVTVAVTAPEEVRLRRIVERDGIPEDAARARVSAQKDAAWFEERCSHVLRNDGEDPQQFYRQAKELFQRIITQKGDD